ncbi:hypothetical protein [Paraburkholderia tropica]|uniref:hypothetical protein n=1 Tax=Paraburkholderia tropica TaxID=92647 RepID=UPI003D26623A
MYDEQTFENSPPRATLEKIEMPNTKEVIEKLVASIRCATDRREAESAIRFASGYIRALDDFRLITAEESREARAAIMNARCAGESEAVRFTEIVTSGDGL